jgi:hypothetical protein
MRNLLGDFFAELGNSSTYSLGPTCLQRLSSTPGCFGRTKEVGALPYLDAWLFDALPAAHNKVRPTKGKRRAEPKSRK